MILTVGQAARIRFTMRSISSLLPAAASTLLRSAPENFRHQIRGAFFRVTVPRLPAGNYEAGRGVFYSEILRVEGESAKTTLLLPPRYRGHEEEIVKIYNFTGVQDVGLRAAWSWFKSLFGGKTAAA